MLNVWFKKIIYFALEGSILGFDILFLHWVVNLRFTLLNMLLCSCIMSMKF